MFLPTLYRLAVHEVDLRFRLIEERDRRGLGLDGLLLRDRDLLRHDRGLDQTRLADEAAERQAELEGSVGDQLAFGVAEPDRDDLARITGFGLVLHVSGRVSAFSAKTTSFAACPSRISGGWVFGRAFKKPPLYSPAVADLYTKNGKPLTVEGDDIFDASGRHVARRIGFAAYGPDGRYAGTIEGDTVVYRSSDSNVSGEPFDPLPSRRGTTEPSRAGSTAAGDEPFE